jgi:hypothetical protein
MLCSMCEWLHLRVTRFHVYPKAAGDGGAGVTSSQVDMRKPAAARTILSHTNILGARCCSRGMRLRGGSGTATSAMELEANASCTPTQSPPSILTTTITPPKAIPSCDPAMATSTGPSSKISKTWQHDGAPPKTSIEQGQQDQEEQQLKQQQEKQDDDDDDDAEEDERGLRAGKSSASCRSNGSAPQAPGAHQAPDAPDGVGVGRQNGWQNRSSTPPPPLAASQVCLSEREGGREKKRERETVRVR